MAAETQYKANTGVATITSANSSMTGVGATTVLTAGANGTLVKTITITAYSTTAEGMVRLFVTGGGVTNLIEEIQIPPITIAATTQAFSYTWNCDIKLQSGYSIAASTQVANSFNIIAEGLDWSYFSGSVRPESTNFNANTGNGVVTTTNSSMTGAGAVTILTAGASASGYKGCRLSACTIKAQGNVTTGMIRFFVSISGTSYLIKEVFIEGTTNASTEPTFEMRVSLNDFNLQADALITASTQNTETFNIIIEGNDWKYPPASSITNFTPASGTSTTSEELLHSLAIPAGLFNTGDVMRVYAELITTNSANNKTFYISVNTTSSISGATKLAKVIYTTTSAESLMRLFPIISATSMGCHNSATVSAQTQYEASTGTTANITVPTVASAFYVIISGQKATAGETDTVQWSIVSKDNQ